MKKSETKREVFSTRINSELLKKIRHLAVDEHKPLNQLLEESIEMMLQSRKKSSK